MVDNVNILSKIVQKHPKTLPKRVRAIFGYSSFFDPIFAHFLSKNTQIPLISWLGEKSSVTANKPLYINNLRTIIHRKKEKWNQLLPFHPPFLLFHLLF